MMYIKNVDSAAFKLGGSHVAIHWLINILVYYSICIIGGMAEYGLMEESLETSPTLSFYLN